MYTVHLPQKDSTQLIERESASLQVCECLRRISRLLHNTHPASGQDTTVTMRDYRSADVEGAYVGSSVGILMPLIPTSVTS